MRNDGEMATGPSPTVKKISLTKKYEKLRPLSREEKEYRRAQIDDFVARNRIETVRTEPEPLPEEEGHGVWGRYR